MWTAQSAQPPGASVITMQHGDIIIVKQQATVVPTTTIPRVQASARTHQHLGGSAMHADPWAEAASKLPSQSKPQVTHAQLAALEAKLSDRIEQVKESSSDEPMEPTIEPRAKALEEKLNKLQETQAQQSNTTSLLAQQVSGIQAQVDTQTSVIQQHIDSRLTEQTSKIEALLSKRKHQE